MFCASNQIPSWDGGLRKDQGARPLHRNLIFFVLCFFCMSCTNAQSNWNKLDVVKRAAIEIRSLQKSQGNSKALAEIDECYGRTLRPSSGYGPAVEACLTKDFVISTTMFAYYMQQSQDEKAKALADGMRRRIASAFLFFGIQNDAPAFGKLLVDNVARLLREGGLE
jgi:hypothetical protein